VWLTQLSMPLMEVRKRMASNPEPYTKDQIVEYIVSYLPSLRKFDLYSFDEVQPNKMTTLVFRLDVSKFNISTRVKLIYNLADAAKAVNDTDGASISFDSPLFKRLDANGEDLSTSSRFVLRQDGHSVVEEKAADPKFHYIEMTVFYYG